MHELDIRSSPGPLEPSQVTQQVRKITSRRAVNSHRPRPMTHAMVPAACATMAKVGARLECRKALLALRRHSHVPGTCATMARPADRTISLDSSILCCGLDLTLLVGALLQLILYCCSYCMATALLFLLHCALLLALITRGASFIFNF